MAALTAYQTSTNDTLVTTARKLSRQAPASEASVTNKTGKSTGWGVLHSQGNTGTWAAGASEPAFGDVNGYILDEAVLEGYGFKAGTWTCKVKLSTTSGTVTSVVHVRVGKRSSAGTFTEIVNCASSSTGITSTAAVVTCTGTTGSDSAVLASGDKLYVQVELQITANSSSSTTATTSLFMNLSTNESIVSPSLYATSSYATAVLNANPKLYWRMDEASGTTAFDNSGNGNDGTYGTGITLNQTGGTRDGSTSASFDNTVNAKVTASSYQPYVASSSRTFMGWANRAALSDWDTFTGDSGGHNALTANNGDETVYFTPDQANISFAWSAAIPGTSQWFHWALTYNDSSRVGELFINGSSLGTMTSSVNFGTNAAFSASGPTNPFNGNMQDVAVFESILSSTTINSIYQAGIPGTANTLTASPGSMAVTGSAVTPPVKHSPTASAGSMAITGSATKLPVAHKPTVSPGSFTITGRSATLPVKHSPTASPGSVVINGTSATLIGPTGTVYTLSVSPGAMSVTGSSTTLPVAKRLTISPASYAITGSSVTPPVHRALVAGSNSMTISGASATLVGPGPPPPSVINNIQQPYGSLWINPY